MKNIDEILSRISRSIIQDLQSYSTVNCSLLGGHFGEILFLYLFSSAGSEERRLADSFLDKMFHGLKRPPYQGSYCNGIAGCGIGLELLERLGYIEGVCEAMSEFDAFLQYELDLELEHDNIDFLHGFIGIGFYFAMRYGCNPDFAQKELLKILQYLKNKNVVEDNMIKWHTRDDAKFNISLSHGISSVILLMIEVLTIGAGESLKGEVCQLLQGASNYLLSQQLDPIKYGSYFPIFPKEVEPPQRSRLAWCYGDLGIAYALWKTGCFLHDQSLKEKVIEIFKYNALERQSVSSSMVVDAEVCHGAAGIASVFRIMYNETQLPFLLAGFEYWVERVFSLSTMNNGLFFPTYNPLKKTWDVRYSLLDGLSGIGLCLLSVKREEWNWTKILLLK